MQVAMRHFQRLRLAHLSHRDHLRQAAARAGGRIARLASNSPQLLKSRCKEMNPYRTLFCSGNVSSHCLSECLNSDGYI